jgi:hypothetical protein
MPPIPVLGIPGWHFAPQDEAFYDDAAHFRSKGPKNGCQTPKGAVSDTGA